MVDKKNKGESIGIVALTLAILSIVFMGMNGIVLGVIALIMSIVQQKKNPTKIGKAALIISIIGIVLAIILIIVFITVLGPAVRQAIPLA